MQLTIKDNFPQVMRELDRIGKGARGVAREALNRAAEWAATDVGREMRKVFDRPVPYTLRSLRVFYANTSNLKATLWFKQRGRDEDKLWAVPQIEGGQRAMKPLELRLQHVRILPRGWHVVPGAAAPMDAYGNMNRGEISRILNVLGTYIEDGYNKANYKTKERLRKGNAKRNAYGFEYWVNPVASGQAMLATKGDRSRRQRHLLPGVYRRVYTAFGTSLKPMLIFVHHARYKRRLDFFNIVRKAMDKHFPAEFDKAMKSFIETGSASALRRAR